MKTQHWMDELDEITGTFRSEFGSLNASHLNWQPNANTWSVAQNIDHLIVINNTYFAVLDRVRAGSYSLPWTARLGFLVTFFGNLILNAVKPDRKRKIKTYPIWEPSKSNLSEDILTQFERHQNKLKEVILTSEDLIAAETVISSPASRAIVYKLETAFDIIVMHERRHLEQARELKRLKLFPR
jgi:hypothetical protein